MTGKRFDVESFGHDKRAAQFTKGGCCDTLTSTDYKDPCIVAYPVQNHPQDSRVTIEEDATTVQTLNAKMGTGGGNTPFILVISSATDTQNTTVESRLSAQAAVTQGGGEGLLVMTNGETHEGNADNHRGAVRKQPPRQLHRAGRVQRHAPGD